MPVRKAACIGTAEAFGERKDGSFGDYFQGGHGSDDTNAR